MNAPANIDRQAVELDERERAVALATGLLLKLDEAAAATDSPVSLEMLRQKRVIVQRYLRWLNDDDAAACTVLGMLGPNGHGPGIDAACDSARYHGFDWQARRAALMDSITVPGRLAPFARALGGVR